MARGIFEKVWYRPDENQWRNMNMLAMRDSGTLVVNDDSLEYHGRKYKFLITDVRKIIYGKQGKDFINNWVKIEYQAGKAAFFADGSLFGWGGVFGGTEKILNAVRHLGHSN